MILCCDIVMILILRPGEVRGGEDTPDGGHQRTGEERDTPESRDKRYIHQTSGGRG